MRTELLITTLFQIVVVQQVWNPRFCQKITTVSRRKSLITYLGVKSYLKVFFIKMFFDWFWSIAMTMKWPADALKAIFNHDLNTNVYIFFQNTSQLTINNTFMSTTTFTNFFKYSNKSNYETYWNMIIWLRSWAIDQHTHCNRRYDVTVRVS